MSEIKLVKRVKYAGDVHAALMELGWDAETAAAFLDDIPDADAVVVVRCKDCKHYHDFETHFDCNHPCGMDYVRPDDFCSCGKQRADHDA